MDFIRWHDNHVPCDDCRIIYSRRPGSPEPPCEDCRVPLQSDNIDLATIYLLTRNQVLMSPSGGVIGLNLVSVYPLLEMYDIEDPISAIALIMRAFNTFQQERTEEARLQAVMT